MLKYQWIRKINAGFEHLSFKNRKGEVLKFFFFKPPESWIWSGKMWPWLSFHFSRPKPKIKFLGLSLLRNQTETLARQAILRRQSRPVVVVGRLGRGRKQSTRGTMGRRKKGGESEQPLLLIKNYLNVQHNINDALSHNCYKCFHLPNAIGGTNTKLLA